MRAKYRVIERFKNKYPIWKMCELFEVSRSGFYKWRKRAASQQRIGSDYYRMPSADEANLRIPSSMVVDEAEYISGMSSFDCTASHAKVRSSGADQTQTSLYAV